MNAKYGAEWNFAYVLPQCPGQPHYLVVPTSLQIGWVESPPIFYAGSKTAREVAQGYCKTKLGTLPPHKFTHDVTGNQAYNNLLEQSDIEKSFCYLLKLPQDIH